MRLERLIELAQIMMVLLSSPMVLLSSPKVLLFLLTFLVSLTLILMFGLYLSISHLFCDLLDIAQLMIKYLKVA